jgi:hypothetical protein
MMDAMRTWRGLLVGILVVQGLAFPSRGMSADADAPTGSLDGTFSTPGPVGGTVWAFRPGGVLFVSGPGELEHAGRWAVAPGTGLVQATLRWSPSGQTLRILAATPPDATRVALLVRARGVSTVPPNGARWPPLSLLVAERVTLEPLPTAAASQGPACGCHAPLPTPTPAT